ncbi:hypothetical protein HDK64DRAFT_341570 [Phyllosticta capitalensis]
MMRVAAGRVGERRRRRMRVGRPICLRQSSCNIALTASFGLHCMELNQASSTPVNTILYMYWTPRSPTPSACQPASQSNSPQYPTPVRQCWQSVHM